MSYVKSVLCMFLLFCGSAFARDVVPVEKLGKLQVLDVNTSTLGGSFDVSRLVIKFRIDNNLTNLKLAEANDVAAGQGCLEVTYKDKNGNAFYTASQCEVKIDEKKLTTVQLAAVKFSWDVSNYHTDVGPQPGFSFMTRDANYKFSGPVLNPAKGADLQTIFVIPAMNLEVNLVHPDTGGLHSQTVALSAGVASEVPIVTKDVRGQILLDFIDGSPTFHADFAPNYITASYRQRSERSGLSRAPSIISEVGVGSYPYAVDDMMNFYNFSEEGKNQTLYAYPVKPGSSSYFYEVAINEHVIKPVVEAGKVTRIPVATVNVHHYKSNIPGEYVVFSDKNVKGQMEEHQHRAGGRSPYVGQKSFPTNTSLFFPIGFTFRLDFYITDDTGRKTLQDQVLVDLTHE
ncbi:hypothetical protein [Bdellovibrio sp. HCB337]|uniref:hypothetical protein n=1 Tax=Bdellovibrio sp. HCB337 TaxID=3394358 RepID=UPI0039A5BD95